MHERGKVGKWLQVRRPAFSLDKNFRDLKFIDLIIFRKLVFLNYSVGSNSFHFALINNEI